MKTMALFEHLKSLIMPDKSSQLAHIYIYNTHSRTLDEQIFIQHKVKFQTPFQS